MRIESLDQYQELALRTARSTLSNDVRQCNWAMGLAGEAGEIQGLFLEGPIDKEALSDELGDILWYGAVMADEYCFKFSDIQKTFTSIEKTYVHARLSVEACKLCDYIKKVVCHGHIINERKVLCCLGLIMKYAERLGEEHGIDTMDVMSRNIEKLMKRYPEGFETERSVNREA